MPEGCFSQRGTLALQVSLLSSSVTCTWSASSSAWICTDQTLMCGLGGVTWYTCTCLSWMNRVGTSRCASAANACSRTCFSSPYSSRFGESAIFSRAPAQARQPRASREEEGCFRGCAVSTGSLPAGIAGAQATVAAQPFEQIAFHAVDILDRG